MSVSIAAAVVGNPPEGIKRRGAETQRRDLSQGTEGLGGPGGRRGTPAEPVKIGMISLGCAKNLVDAEVMLGDAVARGMRVTANADEADVLVVNTCAFIDSAKEESIDAILHAHEQRGLR